MTNNMENAAKAIAHQVEMGVAFDRKEKKLAMTLEAAHPHPQVLHYLFYRAFQVDELHRHN